MDATTVAAIGMETLQLALRAMERGAEVSEEELEAARRRGRESRVNLYDAIEDHEADSEDDES